MTSYFTYVFRGEIFNPDEAPTKYIHNSAYSMVNKTIYYTNFADLSDKGGIILAEEIDRGSISLKKILNIINNYPDVKASWGLTVDTRDIFICQGNYTNATDKTSVYCLPCI